MENYKIENDIQVMCVKADTFPNGVLAAYKKLASLIPNPKERKFFGISHPNKEGVIIYNACTEVNGEDEAHKLGLELFTIKAGNYISEYVEDFMTNPGSTGNAFKELLKDPNIDPQGYCLEIYENMDSKNVLCLVPLK